MIAFVRGKIADSDQESVIVDVHGVGYQVYVPGGVLNQLPPAGSEVRLHTYQHVKEDGIALYGFLNKEDKTVFTQLISINGVGPKLALTILSFLSGEQLQAIVAAEDENALTRVPGIGKKTAKRLILELKDKMTAKAGNAGTTGINDAGDAASETDEAFDALLSLGYNPQEIRAAMQKIFDRESKEIKTLEHNAEKIIKEALRMLAKI